jgi:hypothetical protein
MRAELLDVPAQCLVLRLFDEIRNMITTFQGYNENAGARIYVRLRTDDLRGMRDYRGLINTLLHEVIEWNTMCLGSNRRGVLKYTISNFINLHNLMNLHKLRFLVNNTCTLLLRNFW